MKFMASITNRLIFTQSIVVAITWLLAVAVAAIVLRFEVNLAFDQNLQRHAAQLLALTSHEVEELTDESRDPKHLEEERGFIEKLRVSDADHTFHILGKNQRPLVFPETGYPYESGEAFMPGFSKRDGQRAFTQIDEESGFGIALLEQRELRDAVWKESIAWLILPLAALLPLLAAVAFITVKLTMRPVAILHTKISQRGGRNLEPLNLGTQPRELAPIVDEIETLLARLKATIETERSLAAENAHELRTPIAGALAQLQVLSNRIKDTNHANLVSQAESALKHLVQLSENFLQLSRVEAGFAKSDIETELEPIIEMVIREPAFSGSGQMLHVQREHFAKSVAFVSDDAFAIVVRNLLLNAISHSSPDKPVELVILKNGIAVRNACPVVEEELLQTLTQRFVRGKSRAKGTGLGLAITNSIIQDCGGSLQLSSPIPGTEDGFEAIAEFPSKAD